MDLRQQVFAADDIKRERGVHVPEWGVTFDFYGMTGEARARAVGSSRDEDGKMDTGKLAVAVIIETTRNPENGQLVFGVADRDTLLLKSGAVVDRLATIGLTLSGMTPESREDMRKNSDTASGASTSDSPSASE